MSNSAQLEIINSIEFDGIKNHYNMEKQEGLIVKGFHVSVYKEMNNDYISLTDIARYKDKGQTDDIIKNWMRNRNTIELLGLWEQLHNLNFKPVEFDGFRNQAGLHSFVLTPKKWIETTNSIGLVSKSGRYGGTFAHKDIAFEFASWISIEFKLFIIKEFQRLKDAEASRKNLTWDLQRTISKINYKIHTDAIKENLIPPEITKEQATNIYASEADLLNIALFGVTSKNWRMHACRTSMVNQKTIENIRDEATLEQLIVLSNLESINALLITQNLSSSERIIELNKIAIIQMRSLVVNKQMDQLASISNTSQ
jgi:hypothetical protein